VNTRPITIAALSAACVGSAALLIAGPLAPPGGPVDSTYRTLTEVEPRTPISQSTTPGDADSVYRITQPGSYYLTGNVSVPAGKSGIEIITSNVTIDLRGFTIAGQAGSTFGITGGSGRVTVCNGFVTGVGDEGVDLAGSNNTVEHVVASSLGGFGFSLSGSARECRAASCALGGFAHGVSSRVERCQSVDNGGNGIQVLNDSAVVGCVVRGNVQTGIVVDGAGCEVRACQVLSNGADGIRVFTGNALIEDNHCRSNGAIGVGAGITTTTNAGSVIRNNVVMSNDVGIQCILVNFVVGNTAGLNTTEFSLGASTAGPIVTSANMAFNSNPAANFDF